MGLRDRLDTYDLLAIALVIIGAIFLLSSYIILYIAFGHHQGAFERIKFLGDLSNLVRHIGILILGIGLFLSFRKIYQNVKMTRLFQIVNYTYLILLLPTLYYIYVFMFEKWLVGPSSTVNSLYYFGYHILPGIRRLLLAVMFVLMFIATVKKEWTTGGDTSQEQATEERHG